jgi:hypothetical protein
MRQRCSPTASRMLGCGSHPQAHTLGSDGRRRCKEQLLVEHDKSKAEQKEDADCKALLVRGAWPTRLELRSVALAPGSGHLVVQRAWSGSVCPVDIIQC